MKTSRFTLMVVAALAVLAASAVFAASPDLVAAVLAHHLQGAGDVMLAIVPVVVKLQAEKKTVVEQMRAINDRAAAEDRDLTSDEQTEFDRLAASNRALAGRIEREQALATEEAGLAALAPPAARGQGAVTVPANAVITSVENAEADPRRGFASIGEFLRSVHGAHLAVLGAGQMDRRLLSLGGFGAAAPSTVGTEGTGADGGFLVPPEFSQTLFRLSLEEDALLPYCDEIPVEGNSMTFPSDETTPWGSTGVRAYWQGEAAAATATKPVLGANTLRLKKLMALCPVSDELLADGTALGAFLPAKIAESIRWKANEAILFGAGGGIPHGCFLSGAALVVAKETGQAANTLLPMNLANLVARLPAGSFPRAVWMLNNDVLPALFTLNNTYQTLYIPAGDFKGSPYGTLLGRPIMISQHAKSFSSEGDVNLVDLKYYQAITKAGGIETATSMHLYFDAGATAYRSTFRMDGQSKLKSAITPANGSNNLSPFVQLGAR